MKPAQGFSLLELLIGLALLSIIMVLLFAGFRLASQSWDAVDTNLQRTAEGSLTREAIHRVVEQIVPLRMQRLGGRPIAFIGEPSRLVAATSGARFGDGVRIFELAVSASSSKGHVALSFRHAPFRYDAESKEGLFDAAEPPRILSEEVERIDFAYFGRSARDAEPGWSSEWTNNDEYPSMARVRIHHTHEGWSEINIPIHAAAGKCTLDLQFKLRCA